MATIAAEFLPRIKTLHLVRHAEGLHNLEADKSRDPKTAFQFRDAQLSSLGWQQVLDQRNEVCSTGLLNKIEIVITSPMSRTLQTAAGIFHGEYQAADGLAVASISFEDENGKSKEASSTAVNHPPILAYELCRERMGKYECDKRGCISQYRSRFPAVDFSLIENEDDILWKAGERESVLSVKARGMEFIKWLWTRKEKEIAVVSHGVFLQHAMVQLVDNNMGHPSKGYTYDPYSRFKNCEIRSIDIYYERVMGMGMGMGSDSFGLTNKHCGSIRNSIPYGLEIPKANCKDVNVSVEELEVTN